MKYEWSEGFALGIKEIDNQHKYFVGLMNEIHTSAIDRKPDEILSSVLKKLSKYAKNHFDTEDKYFEQIDYKDADKHRSEHAKLLHRIDALCLKKKRAKDLGRLSLELLDFMEDWLVVHLNEMDRKFVETYKIQKKI